MTCDAYLSVIPICTLYSLFLQFSNSAYIYLSVSFIQMLKGLMPVAVYSIFILLKKDHFSTNTMANMVSIFIGVNHQARFDSWGVLQLTAVAFEAIKLILIQILLTSKGISLNPITSLCYIAPYYLVFLFVSSVLAEFPLLKQISTFKLNFLIFGSNFDCTFALNLAIFLLIGKTSALTMNVAEVVKDWVLIAFSWSAIKDTVTPVNLVGYRIAILGITYCNHLKLQAMKAKEAQKKSMQANDEEAGGLLLEEREGEASRRKNKLQS